MISRSNVWLVLVVLTLFTVACSEQESCLLYTSDAADE